MVLRTLYMVVVLNILAFPVWAGNVRYFSALPSLPLMEGLSELDDHRLIFDKPEGRIIESLALIEQGSIADIEAFYAQTLPQLGWRSVGRNNFTRQSEHLQLKFEETYGQNFIRIMVQPR